MKSMLALGKLVHHRCGTPVWAEVLDHIGDQVVVNYRDAGGMLIFLCPGCGRPLRLWWDAPQAVVRVEVEREEV